jgi:hypothetical protein
MRRRSGPDAAGRPLADARRRALQAVDVPGYEPLTGPEILRRMTESAAEVETGPGPGADRAISPDDQALLYPALHSLEADWKVQATWVADADGMRHRTYRRRQLLPRSRGAASR